MATAKKKDSRDSAWFMQTKPTPKKAAAKPAVGKPKVSYEMMRGMTDDLRMKQKAKDKKELEPKTFKKKK